MPLFRKDPKALESSEMSGINMFTLDNRGLQSEQLAVFTIMKGKDKEIRKNQQPIGARAKNLGKQNIGDWQRETNVTRGKLFL